MKHHKKPAYFINVTSSQAVRLSMYSIMLLLLGGSIFDNVIASHTNSIEGGVVGTLLYVVAYAAVLVVHELVHGAAFTIFGGKVHYGAGFTSFLPYFYATSRDTPFRLWQMYIIGLAPFVLLSAATLAGAALWPSLSTYFSIAFIGNFAGAVGDLWLMSQIARFRTFDDVTVVDEKSGMAVFTPDVRVKKLVAKLNKKSRASSFINLWIWGSFGILMLSVIIFVVGPFFQSSLTVGPSDFSLAQYTVNDTTTELTINILPPIVGGFLFAVIARITLLTALRQR